MKPVFMRLKAFGPFANEVEISFERVFNGGLFLIHGRTGAGKTSLLDGLCFSLFGRPSSEEREKEISGLRSDLALVNTLTETELVFAVGEQIYRVHRIPTQKTPKKRGEGMTEHKGSAELFRLVGDAQTALHATNFQNLSWLPLAGKVEAVDLAIENLLGMNERQFRQVVVLPQGKFREFLSSTSSDRQIILEKLFQTDRFSKLQQFITSRARASQAEWENASKNLHAKLSDLGLNSFEEISARKNATVAAADTSLKSLIEARKAVEKLTGELNRAREFQITSKRLAALHEESARLQIEEPKIDTSEKVLRSARAWAPYFQIEDVIRASELKKAELDARLSASIRSEAELMKQDQLNRKQQAELTAMTPSIDQISRELSRLRELVPSLRDIARVSEQIANDDKLDAKSMQELEQLNRQLVDLEARQNVDFNSIFAIDASLRATEARMLELEDRRVKELELGFHVSEVSRIAESLSPGKPCPVCGSLSHPSPALAAKPAKSKLTVPILTAPDIAKEKGKFDRLRIEFTERRTKREARLEPFQAQKPVKIAELAITEDDAASAFSIAFEGFEKVIRRRSNATQSLEVLRERIKTRDQAKISLAKTLADKEAQVPASDRSLSEITERGTKLKSEYDCRESEIRDAEVKANATEKEVSRVQGSIAALSDELTRHNLDLNRVHNDLKTLEVALAETRPETRLVAATMNAMQSRIDTHRNAVTRSESAIGEIEQSLQRAESAREQDSLAPVDNIESRLADASENRLILEESATRLKIEAENLAKFESETKASGERLALLKDEAERAARIAALLSGDRAQNKLLVPLSRFVLQSRFEEVLIQANRRLLRMSRGQFQLRRPALSKNLRDSQGLEIRVEDSNAGTERHAGSLSGGESFMASLSLALGLADVVQADLGGVKIDSVMIDEGFGTLDSESLDLAMKTLTDLQAGGRMVGIISHVQELKTQVLHRLEVEKTSQGSRVSWNDSTRRKSESARDVSP